MARSRAKLVLIGGEEGGCPSVALEFAGTTVVGEARDGTGDEAERIAMATFAAAEALIGKRSIFTLNFARTLRVGDALVVLVAVVLREGEREIELVGTSFVADDDGRTACARAALDAVNRYVELFLPLEG